MFHLHRIFENGGGGGGRVGGSSEPLEPPLDPPLLSKCRYVNVFNTIAIYKTAKTTKRFFIGNFIKKQMGEMSDNRVSRKHKIEQELNTDL